MEHHGDMGGKPNNISVYDGTCPQSQQELERPGATNTRHYTLQQDGILEMP